MQRLPGAAAATSFTDGATTVQDARQVALRISSRGSASRVRVEMGVHGLVTDAQREALARAQRGQQRLLMLVNDILNFAKLEAGRIDYHLDDVPLADAVAGLAISRALARGMGGDLRVRSAEGHGTTFTLMLRRAREGSSARRDGADGDRIGA